MKCTLCRDLLTSRLGGEILWRGTSGRMNNLHHICRIMQSKPPQHFFALALILIRPPDCLCAIFPNEHWVLVVICLPVTAGMGAMMWGRSGAMIKCWRCSRSDEKSKQFVARRRRVYKSLFNTPQSCCFPFTTIIHKQSNSGFSREGLLD